LERHEVFDICRNTGQFTSWDAIHQTLVNELPQEWYHCGVAVEAVKQTSRGLTVAAAGQGAFDTDVLIAADGAQSPARRRLYPDLEADYGGYVAWRGIVDERDLPPDLVAAFDDIFTFSDARSGRHALAYFIPGDGLVTGVGHLRVNWVRYVGAAPA
jgi:2-polyprenyl-6-methoxyphenol hydroxylase-like FAD-dependent oxidoreductase